MNGLIKTHYVPVVTCLATLCGPSFKERILLIREFMSNAVKFRNGKSNMAVQYHKNLEEMCSKEGLSTFKFNILGEYPFKELMWLLGTKRLSLSLCMLCCILQVLRSRKLNISDLCIPSDECKSSENGELPPGEKHAQWIFHEVIKRLMTLKHHPEKLGLLMSGVAFINIVNVGPSKAAYEFLPFLRHYCKKLMPLIVQPARAGTNVSNLLYSLMPQVKHLSEKDDSMTNQLPGNGHLLPNNVAHSKLIFKEENCDLDVKVHKVDLSMMEDTKKTLEEIVVNNMSKYRMGLPIRYVFLHSLLQTLDISLMPKNDITKLAVSCDIGMDDSEVEVFLNHFTKFASLFYVPSLTNIVIVNIEKFTDCVDKLYNGNPSEESSYEFGFISEAAIDSLAEKEKIDPEMFKVALQCFRFAVPVRKAKVQNPSFTINGKLSYYVPSMRNGKPMNGPLPSSLYLKIKPRYMPGNMQVLLVRQMLNDSKCFLIPTEHVNASIISMHFQHTCAQVILIDHGDAIEFRLQENRSIDYIIPCSLIVRACFAAIKVARKSIDHLQYDFVFRCTKQDHQYHDDLKSALCCNDDKNGITRDFWIDAVSNMVNISFICHSDNYIFV